MTMNKLEELRFKLKAHYIIIDQLAEDAFKIKEAIDNIECDEY